ncbi:Pleiotropic drug resistance protein 4, partial [Tetrabaena socialis]
MVSSAASGAKQSVCSAGKEPPVDVRPAVHAATGGERDHSLLLEKLTSRMERGAFLTYQATPVNRVGLTFPGIEVRWENLMVEVKVEPKCSSSKDADSGGKSRLTDRFACTADPKKKHIILNAGSGVLAPGRMTLLLGPPGAGRTTLLKALAGQLQPAKGGSGSGGASWLPWRRDGDDGGGSASKSAGLRVYGKVLYNGLSTHGTEFQAARAAAYVAQTENHLPEMTVAETLTFAAECQGSTVPKRLHNLLIAKEAAAGLTPEHEELETLFQLAKGGHAPAVFVELVSRMLGIDHVMDTLVGDEMVKGISGGQKRRVTCGEMTVGMAQVMMLDEITNGLDAASALSIVRSLRNICSQGNATLVATLLQPSPEVYECFDDVLLLSHGRAPGEEEDESHTALAVKAPHHRRALPAASGGGAAAVSQVSHLSDSAADDEDADSSGRQGGSGGGDGTHVKVLTAGAAVEESVLASGCGSLRARPASGGSAAPAPAVTEMAVLPVGGSAAAADGSSSGGGVAAWAAPVDAPADGEAGEALAFRPVVMVFRDISYFVPLPADNTKKLQLLNKVSGVFRPGVLTSLMGASGAGKTTLMDVLAGRKTGGKEEGSQLINGAPKRMSTFARLMGYVEQVDVHNPYATIEEALLFSARLRVAGGVLAPSAVRGFVRRMLEVVELAPLAGHIVGTSVGGAAAGGLSTEARKRLTIAVELVANPSVLFMDEPTT